MKTIRLTMTQALIKYLCNQFIIIDGKKERLFGGGFAIFGHGNVTCLSEALYDVQDILPTYRGQNEQSMALAAIGYTKANNRQRIMFATSSIGPGATNMVTAAGVAYTNSLPLLILSGDYFNSREPDPVLQQIEQVYNPTLSANDCFKPVTKYWDRITAPSQIISSLPNAISTMLDPATCGPVFLGLCQDTQAIAYDYPANFFDEKIHHIPRVRADVTDIFKAVEAIKESKNPIIIIGGGVNFSQANKEVLILSQQCQIPLCETMSAKSTILEEYELHIGPVGIAGSKSINDLAKHADAVIAIGTRFQDFTTGSWSLFANENVKIIAINTNRLDSIKHKSVSIVGDAKAVLLELNENLKDYKSESSWVQKAKEGKAVLNNFRKQKSFIINDTITYANVVTKLNTLVCSQDRIIAAAGGLPGELNTLYEAKGVATIDNEFGFSCMGYEISGGYGSAIANKQGENIVLTGDGSYLMLNSEIFSSVLTTDKMIIIVCDNGGFGVINRLQVNQGGEEFNNLIKDCKIEREPFMCDFVAHAKSMGANGEFVHDLQGFSEAFKRAKKSDVTYIIHIKVDQYSWSEHSECWWEVGVPEISPKTKIQQARASYEKNKQTQQRK